MSEHKIQNEIRLAVSAAKAATLFRANVGQGWQGRASVQGDTVILRGARPFSTGLPKGFPDLFGVKSVTVTPAMVGQKLGVFVYLEVKTLTGRVRREQAAVLQHLQAMGARGGVARSAADALALLSSDEKRGAGDAGVL